MESVDMEVKKLVVRIKYCMIFISLHTTVTCGLVSERVFSICAIKYPPILRIRIGCAGISASEIVSFPSNPLPSGTEIYA